MAEIVLRVRLIGGEHLDVTYEEGGGTPDETADRVISTLAEDNGLLRCRHGGRLIVLYGRGVVTLEVAPRSRPLTSPAAAGAWRRPRVREPSLPAGRPCLPHGAGPR